MDARFDLINDDCLVAMRKLPENSIDLVICDLPYGVLNRSNKGARWDHKIPLDKLWCEYERVCKTGAVIILFGQGMFTAELMMSNRKLWKYNLVWKKGDRCSGFLNANRQPLRSHEDIIVFSWPKSVYHPQMTYAGIHKVNHGRGDLLNQQVNNCYGKFKALPTKVSEYKYPKSVLDFPQDFPPIHPTQKPVALLEYLIRTYSNKGDTVLDNCMGSGSTGVACFKTDRNFIGIELDKKVFEMAKQRIGKETVQVNMMELLNDD